MRAVVQRVSRAEVRAGGETVGTIGPGLCVLLSIGPDDEEATARRLADRVASLRIFPDGGGRMNVDALGAGAGVLVVSQFTLHADTRRGHRPSFAGAAPPEAARRLCEVVGRRLEELGLAVATGRFGAHMEVELVNDGPVTMVLSSGEGPWEADAG